jgi:anti-sigma-K factor RskA
MSHPDEVVLALYAGGELGFWERRRAGRHIRGCADCRRAVEEYREARLALRSGAGELPPDVQWARLAAEMKANIRVGLAAGECVGPVETAPARAFWKTAVALVPVTLVVLAGVWLQRSQPPGPAAPAPEGIVLEATSEGIQLRQGEGVLEVQHPQAGEVMHSVSAEGTLRARYVDSETGYVTIAHVYAE